MSCDNSKIVSHGVGAYGVKYVQFFDDWKRQGP